MKNEHHHPNNKTKTLKKRLIEIFKKVNPPKAEEYISLLKQVNYILENEDENIRPHDSSGLCGGIVYLKHDIPTIIVPDLHARREFFLSLMLSTDITGYSNLQKLCLDMLQIVCVGDGFHAEGSQAKRWGKAFEEYKTNFKRHRYMDEEMRDSLGVMEMVQEVKIAFPANFHFLKGNHENIANEQGNGNHPFRKYAIEGTMVLDYIMKFYSEEFLKLYYSFEKNFPLLAVGKNFIISHAEPAAFYDMQSVIEFRNNPEVIEGLTWTPNDGSEEGTIEEMIEHYLDESQRDFSYYFGGHRPIRTLYNLRADGRYVQFHNPGKFVITVIKPDREIDLSKDIIEIENRINEII
ncbi:hypothetical protein ES703_92765 [subsurface metagenome]